MDRTLFLEMLKSRAELSVQGDEYSPQEGAGLDLLLRAESGALTTLSRVKTLRVGAKFVSAETEDASWVLGFESLAGLKVLRKGEGSGRRTGFLP